jgi:hypothetical protein
MGKATYNEFTEDGVIKHTEELDFWYCTGEWEGFSIIPPKKVNPKLEHEILLPTVDLLKELLKKV